MRSVLHPAEANAFLFQADAFAEAVVVQCCRRDADRPGFQKIIHEKSAGLSLRRHERDIGKVRQIAVRIGCGKLCVDDLRVCTDKKIGQWHGCKCAAGVASAMGRGESRFAGLLSKRVPAKSWLERLGFHCGADFGGRTLAWAGLSHQLFKHVITLRRPAHTEHIPRGAHPEGIRGVSGQPLPTSL